MIYYLHHLSEQFIGFHVFLYVTFRAIAAAVAGVDEQRAQVGGAELPRAEDVERHHRVGAAVLDQQEGS